MMPVITGLLGIMPAAYSTDLRKRVASAYLAGEGTRDEIAERFQISSASVGRYVRLWRAMGSVERTPQRGGAARRVRLEDEALFESWLGENPSLTQTELAVRYRETTGRAVSQRTISRTLSRMGITRKKSRSTPRSAKRPT